MERSSAVRQSAYSDGFGELAPETLFWILLAVTDAILAETLSMVSLWSG